LRLKHNQDRQRRSSHSLDNPFQFHDEVVQQITDKWVLPKVTQAQVLRTMLAAETHLSIKPRLDAETARPVVRVDSAAPKVLESLTVRERAVVDQKLDVLERVPLSSAMHSKLVVRRQNSSGKPNQLFLVLRAGDLRVHIRAAVNRSQWPAIGSLKSLEITRIEKRRGRK
jgi:hypothetical protein